MEYFDNERINEMLNKMWSGDMFTLTTAEIHNIIKNSMWQTFLVDAYDISVKTNFSEGIVKIEIEGEMLMDMTNIVKGIEILEEELDGEEIGFIFEDEEKENDSEEDDE